MTSTAQEHIDKARETLDETRVLFEKGFTRGVCNRAYYTVFEAAHAILSSQNIPRPKTHSGLISQFSQHIVQAGLIDPDTGRILSEIESARLVADYTGKSISGPQVKEIVDKAEKFVSVIENRLDKDTR